MARERLVPEESLRDWQVFVLLFPLLGRLLLTKLPRSKGVAPELKLFPVARKRLLTEASPPDLQTGFWTIIEKVLHPEDLQTLEEELLRQRRFNFSFWSLPLKECPFLRRLEARVSSYPSLKEEFEGIVDELAAIEQKNMMIGLGWWIIRPREK